MEPRKIGRSELEVSAIGLGGNTFGRTVDGDEAVAVVRCALDLGITFIDTADGYSLGRSEELIGQAVAGRRSEVILATKCGGSMEAPFPRTLSPRWMVRAARAVTWRLASRCRLPIGPRPTRGGLSRRWIMQAAEDSLRRLGTDHIDLYQAHFPDPATPIEETLRAMDDLVRQGKVRYIGCSNYTAGQLVEARGIAERNGLAPWVSAQDHWNVLDGLKDPSLLPTCRELGMGMIPYTPLASGILTGKYRRGEEPPPGTRAAEVPNVRARLTDARIAAVERLRPWAEERGHTTAELGIAWLLAYPEVSSVIVGARSAAQVEQNVRAAEWSLSEAERDEAHALAQRPDDQSADQ